MLRLDHVFVSVNFFVVLNLELLPWSRFELREKFRRFPIFL